MMWYVHSAHDCLQVFSFLDVCGCVFLFQIGGATGHIGDPSERSTERPSISSELVFKNADGIKENIENVFQNFRKYFAADEKLLPVK